MVQKILQNLTLTGHRWSVYACPKKKNREQFACAGLMLGANHIRVRCHDGVERLGRIKGKIKKRSWIREGDILIVIPWSFQDEKCDILYRYLPPQADWLRKNRYL